MILSVLALLALGSLPAASSAQQADNFTVGLMAGLGGSTEDSQFDNFGFQAFFAVATELQARVVVRLGQLELESDETLFKGDLTYLTVAGEYNFRAPSYDSGVFLGLGFYDLSADFFGPDDSGIGLTLGTSSDFRLTDRLSMVAEISGHFADLEDYQFFLLAHAGLAYHF